MENSDRVPTAAVGTSPVSEGHQHNEQSPSPDFRGAHGVIMQIENMGRGVFAVLVGGVILGVLLAGMALIRAESLADRVVLAEREARVAQERTADMKVELIRRGIPVSDH